MSERTFRAVIAAVLVGFLVLTAVALVALVPRPEPAPSAPPEATVAPSPSPPIPTATIRRPAFGSPSVHGVGTVARGATSDQTLVLQFTESDKDAIPRGPGSFRVILSDHAGDGSTVDFAGTPSIVAPGSLGALASITSPNVLWITIEDSDTYNVEQLTIKGLGIRASSTAAIGRVDAKLGEFSGSLAFGLEGEVVLSVASVVAGP